MRNYIYLLGLLLATTACQDLTPYFEATPTDSVITLAALDNSPAPAVVADGKSALVIKAVLNDANADAGHEVAFSITEGTLTEPGAAANASSTGTLTRKAAEYEALVQVNPGLTVQDEVVLTATVAGVQQVLHLNYTRAYPEEVSLSPNVAQIAVDNSTTFTLDLDRAQGTPSAGLPITVTIVPQEAESAFEYNRSLMYEGSALSIPVKNLGLYTGEAQLHVTVPTSADSSETYTAVLAPVTMYPDEAILSPNTARAAVTDTVTLSLSLSRMEGAPSSGLSIAVAVAGPQGTPVRFQYPTTLLYQGQVLEIPIVNVGQDTVEATVTVTIPTGPASTIQRTATLIYPE